ncbi:hypothetical protein NL320_27370, partial [Klebsiella pneumoniae]|nr:hypothetical protein [Klebsiella pneumoniae]
RIGADHRRIGPNYPIVDEALLRAQYYLSYPLHGHHSGTIAKACFKRFQSGANLYEGLQAFLLGMRVQAGKLADDTVGHSS